MRIIEVMNWMGFNIWRNVISLHEEQLIYRTLDFLLRKLRTWRLLFHQPELAVVAVDLRLDYTPPSDHHKAEFSPIFLPQSKMMLCSIGVDATRWRVGSVDSVKPALWYPSTLPGRQRPRTSTPTVGLRRTRLVTNSIKRLLALVSKFVYTGGHEPTNVILFTSESLLDNH